VPDPLTIEQLGLSKDPLRGAHIEAQKLSIKARKSYWLESKGLNTILKQRIRSVSDEILDFSAKAIQALIRDGFRCIVSGRYDANIDLVPYMNVTYKEIMEARGVVYTQCAHIVPDSTYFTVNGNSLNNVWQFSCLLDLIPYLCVDRLFCLRVGSLEVVRVQYRHPPRRESAFFVQCDDDAARCSRIV
jgi:hypothetical protein